MPPCGTLLHVHVKQHGHVIASINAILSLGNCVLSIITTRVIFMLKKQRESQRILLVKENAKISDWRLFEISEQPVPTSTHPTLSVVPREKSSHGLDNSNSLDHLPVRDPQIEILCLFY